MSIINKLKKAFILMFEKPVPRPINVQNIVLNPCNLLDGRCALITGGTSGIGLAMVISFLRAGARVFFTGRSQDKIDKALAVIKENVPNDSVVSGIVLDVTDNGKIESEFSRLFSEYKIDILVNNAGVIGKSFPYVDCENFDKVIDTNLRGAFFCSQEFAKNLKRYYPNQHANILNISSSSSLRPGISPYTLSKWGIRSLTLGLAKALAPHNITVNAIAPGPTATPMLIKEGESLEFNNSPISRYILPEEVANMAVILVSPLCQAVVGDTLFMTGGAGVITFEDINYTISF